MICLDGNMITGTTSYDRYVLNLYISAFKCRGGQSDDDGGGVTVFPPCGARGAYKNTREDPRQCRHTHGVVTQW